MSLTWEPIHTADLNSRIAAAAEERTPELGVRRLGEIAFVSIPSFNWFGDRSRTMESFLESLKRQIADIRETPVVVVDVRGNGGGNSEWADKVAELLWGEDRVKSVTDTFDDTVDWRASRQNISLLTKAADRSEAAGLTADAQYRREIARGMQNSINHGRPYFHEEVPPKQATAKPQASPFKGRVFFLTDLRCASACLDFADIVLRMPSVIHIGEPTFADAVYIDNVQTPLPSNHAELGYSLKVYRNRVRSNNQYYTPAFQPSEGPLDDKAVLELIHRGSH